MIKDLLKRKQKFKFSNGISLKKKEKRKEKKKTFDGVTRLQSWRNLAYQLLKKWIRSFSFIKFLRVKQLIKLFLVVTPKSTPPN